MKVQGMPQLFSSHSGQETFINYP